MKVKEAFMDYIDEDGKCLLTDDERWEIALKAETPVREEFTEIEDGYPF